MVSKIRAVPHGGVMSDAEIGAFALRLILKTVLLRVPKLGHCSTWGQGFWEAGPPFSSSLRFLVETKRLRLPHPLRFRGWVWLLPKPRGFAVFAFQDFRNNPEKSKSEER
jgi:hypothetical protein